MWSEILLPLIVIFVFIAGLIVGIVITTYGFRLGFKASYQIRDEPDDAGKGLFPPKKEDPKEFAVLDEQEKKEDEEDLD